MEKKLMDFNSYAVRKSLKRLLKDKSSKKNIIWATNNYQDFGYKFSDKNQIREEIIKNSFTLKPRYIKAKIFKLIEQAIIEYRYYNCNHFSFIPKVSAVIASIPDGIIGNVSIILFRTISAIGISNT